MHHSMHLRLSPRDRSCCIDDSVAVFTSHLMAIASQFQGSYIKTFLPRVVKTVGQRDVLRCDLRRFSTAPTRMSTGFIVQEHSIPCSHTRQYLHATVNGDQDAPRLAVKQYTPHDNVEPKPGDVTIIAAHANGFPKVGGIAILQLYTFSITGRKCTSHCGTQFLDKVKNMDSAYDLYGWQTIGRKDNQVCSTRRL
jgi:hypothetical protein